MKTPLSLLMILVLTLGARAQTTAPTPPAGASAASQPATAPTTEPAVDPAAKKILDILQAAGVTNKTIISEKMTYVVYNPTFGDKQTRTGTVQYRRDKPDDFTRFRIHFDTVQTNSGDRIIEREDYALAPDADGALWLVVADETNKKLTRYQVGRAGQKVEPFEIGKGPFPVPFGQQTENVLKICIATTGPLDTKAPDYDRLKNTLYLKLVPKPAAVSKVNFAVLEMWVDPKLGLPIKIVSTEKNKRSTTVTFDDVKLNAKIDDKVFTIPRPAGWHEEVKPLQGNVGPAAP